jgi:lysyl-tRNA synthetase class 1
VESGLLKLNWRLDWPAKWSLEPKNQFEGSGKDHYTKITGSWDVAVDLCKEIFNYEGPVGLGFEWLRLGDKDMGTSKGVVFKPKTYLEMVEPELLRMLILKTNPSRHISFRIEEISLLYDEFEKIERIFYGIEKAETEQIYNEIQFFYPLIRTKKISKLCPVQIPFKFLIIMAQLQDLLSIDSIIEKSQNLQILKGLKAKITKKYMKKRLDQTLNWLNYLKGMIQEEKDGKITKNLMRKANFFSVSESITEEIMNQLDENQKESVKKMSDFLNSTDSLTEENLKNEMVKIQEIQEIKAKSLFQAIYLILIGVKKGPRLGPFLTLLDINWLRNRFSSIT